MEYSYQDLKNVHPLLLRQMKNHLKIHSLQEADSLSPAVVDFLQAISKAYYEYEEEQAILERSLELSSEELLEANTRLHNLLTNVESQVRHRTEDLSKSNAALEKALRKLKETQLQLIQTEKMSSLGQMVAGIAHEINNPLNFIQGNLTPLSDYFSALLELLQLYRSEYPEPNRKIDKKSHEIDLDFLLQDLPELLNSMQVGTQRVQKIVLSLRNFSRIDESSIKDVNIHEGIESTLLILNHRIKQGVEIIKEYDELPVVRCCPAQLNQVFTNILANALDAVLETEVQPKRIVIKTHLIDSQKVKISIQDNGPGISPAIKSRIFDPFFTTKTVGKGTGLGLGISFKIIEQHRGRIDVFSEMGQGAEFVITLPVDMLRLPSTENLGVKIDSL